MSEISFSNDYTLNIQTKKNYFKEEMVSGKIEKKKKMKFEKKMKSEYVKIFWYFLYRNLFIYVSYWICCLFNNHVFLFFFSFSFVAQLKRRWIDVKIATRANRGILNLNVFHAYKRLKIKTWSYKLWCAFKKVSSTSLWDSL